MCCLLKKYFVFIVGAFFCSLFWCWHLQQTEKNDNSVTAKAEASYNQTTTAFIDSIGETAR
ncbi:Peptidoglycan hydrolase [Streptococcus thermophilus]|nr:Peptidoglycan hydrolase [Streptococcus thermophilus]CAD0163423.1 Peptidoglycan hydrolase [Streptococcus thermophilus]